MSKNRQIMFKTVTSPGLTSLRRKSALIGSLLIVLFLGSAELRAGDADVVDVSVKNVGENRYSFDVTVSHADTGWDHYANGWDVLDENGNVLGTRELLHPHVNEQPFTRSLTINIDPAVKSVTLRATDSVHGHEGKSMTIELPQP